MKKLLHLIWRILWPFLWRAGAVVLAVLLLLSIYLGFAAYASPPRDGVGEHAPEDEALHFAQIADNGEHIVNNTRNDVKDGAYRRDAHAKTQGCALASFNVDSLTDNRLKYGVFKEKKSYRAWVRFSSGDFGIQSDQAPDARGMAIKVLGVEGPKLLDGEQAANTQDFLMIDYPVFFVRNVNDYVTLTSYQSLGEAHKLDYFFPNKLNPFSWRMREFRIGVGLLGSPLQFYFFGPRNLLATRFYSMSAYRLGAAQYTKFSAKPVACAAGGSTPGWWTGYGSEVLRESLTDQVKSGRNCFDLMLQLQDQQKYMPVEDATIEWKESDSPFIPVARITIEKQDISTSLKNDFCENLSFSPWHALPEHEPVGALNRARKVVYQNIARYRRCSNGKYFGEPRDDGSQEFTTTACKATEPVPAVKTGMPAP